MIDMSHNCSPTSADRGTLFLWEGDRILFVPWGADEEFPPVPCFVRGTFSPVVDEPPWGSFWDMTGGLCPLCGGRQAGCGLGGGM